MEDATITQEPLVRERFPSVVDTDDLIFELGKKDVKALNLEKLLNGLIKKTEVASQTATDLSENKVEIAKKVSSLQESNKLYEKNNRKLDRELIKVRQELSDQISINTQLTEKLNEVQQVKRKSRKKKQLTDG
jgi:small-conductance mechanosensitive channel